MRLFIIAVVLMGLSAVAGSIIVGSRSYDGVVVEKPYETGISWDQRRHENEATGWRVDILNSRFTMGKNEIVVSAKDAEGNELKDAEVSVVVSRPSTRAYDATFKALWSPEGIYKTAVSFPVYGYWDLKVGILKEGKSYNFEKRVYAEKEGQQ